MHICVGVLKVADLHVQNLADEPALLQLAVQKGEMQECQLGAKGGAHSQAGKRITGI